MVAIVSGMRSGLDLNSGEVLGFRDVIGGALPGRNGQGVSVNVALGQVVVQDQDDLLVGRGQDIPVVRTYNSNGSFNDDNGDGWTSGVALLRPAGTLNAPGSSIQRVGPDGGAASYSFDPSRNLYVSTEGAGAYDTITYIAADGQYEWRDGATGTTQRYEGSGAFRLLATRDAAGNAITCTYGTNGFLASVTTANGESVCYDYAGNNLSQVRTVAGGITTTRVRYAYDPSNRLAAVTVDLSPSDNSVADGRVYRTAYTYDGSSKRIASITQSDGTSVAFTYVDVGGGTYKVATVRDGLNQATAFTYGTRFTTVTDPLGFVTRYDYDASCQLTAITGPAVAGASAIRQFAYDGWGNVASVSDGEGRTVTYQYDDRGNQVMQRDGAGDTVLRSFDVRNQLLSETRSADAGLPLVSRNVYDDAGRNLLRFSISAEGRVTEYRYDGFGQKTASLTHAEATYPFTGVGPPASFTEAALAGWCATQDLTRVQRVDYTYDGRGQQQTRTTYARTGATGEGVVDGTQSLERSVYDASGLLLQTFSARNGTATFTYDGLGRALTTTNALGQVAVTQYDDAGGRILVTQANGLLTTSAYDAAGRLVSVAQSGTAGAALGETRYFYDADNRLRMTQDPTGVRSWVLYDPAGRKAADIDGNGSMTEYCYDRGNQLVGSTTWGTAVNTALLVNPAGLPVTSVSAASLRPAASANDYGTWRQYDAAGRLVREATSAGVGQAALVTEMRYDGASRLVQTIRYASTVPAVAGNVALGAVTLPAASPQDRVARNFYDGDGRLAGTVDAEGYLTVFKYTAAGQLAERTRHATAVPPPAPGATIAQVTPPASPDDIREFTFYDGKGQVLGQVDGEGYLTESVYDASGNAVRTVRYAMRLPPFPPGTSPQVMLRPPPSPADRTTVRSFDLLDRLVQETSPEGVITQYTYDSAGDVVSTVRAAGSTEVRTLLARYDLQGRLTGELSAEGAALLAAGQTQQQVDAIWAAYGSTYTYDAASRRTSRTDALGQRTLFFYNADGALTHAVNALGEVQETRYDARGRVSDTIAYANRIATTGLAGGLVPAALTSALAAVANAAADSHITCTYTREGQVATRLDAVGTLTTETYNAFGEETGRQVTGAGTNLLETYALDRLGRRTASARDPSGLNVVTSSVYDAFGRLVRTIDANGNVRQQAYDRLGRIVSTRDPVNALRSSSYDAFGRVLTQTDALGNTTQYAYDAIARTMTVTTPEGISTATTYTRHGQVQSIRDGNGFLTSYVYDRNGNLLRTITPANTKSSTYDAAGRLADTTDANGNKVAYAYDAANRVLARRVDPSGLNLVTSYAYDGKGQRISVTDPNGVVTTTEYDRNGQVLKQTVDPAGLKLQTVYAYDASGNVLSVRSPGGTVTQYVYDALGRRVQERVDPAGLNLQRTWSYDANGNVAWSTDARGNPTRYAYDADDRLVYTLDALGNVRQNSYDAEGRIVKTVAYATAATVVAAPIAMSVSAIRSLVITQAALDVVENRVYDKDGRLACTVDGTGAVVRLAYDGKGNVVARTAYANRANLATWVAGTMPAPVADSARDAIVRTVYDSLGRAIYSVDGIGAVVALAYDGNGNVLQRTAYATAIAPATVATQDAIAVAVAAVANGARDRLERNTYDAAGRLVWTVDGTGAVTQQVYDRNGNVTRQVAYATPLPAGAYAGTVVTSSADRATTMAYDNANRLVLQVDALRGVTEQAFDADGHVVRRTAYATALPVDPPSGMPNAAALIRPLIARDPASDRTTRYAFDVAGRQVLAVDATGAVTETRYDGAGNVTTAIAYARAVDPSALSDGASIAAVKALVLPDARADRVTRNAYDAAGRCVHAVDALGGVQANQYDGAGRLIRTTRYANVIAASVASTPADIAAALRVDAARDQPTTFVYNAAGQLLSSTDALNGRESNTYDALGRKLTFTNKKGSIWTYTYDAAGRQLTETSPLVALATVTLAADGSLVATAPANAAVVTRMAYDALGDLVQKTEAAGRPEERTTRYEYDASGRQVRVVYPAVGVYNAAADAVTTNGANGVATRVETTQLLETRTWYDALGNAVANRDVGGGLSQKAYDVLGRVAYEVDAVGCVTGYTRNAFGDVTRLVRYGGTTTLAAASVTQANQAATRAQVQAALAAAAFDHSRDRTLLTTCDRMGRVVEEVEPTAYVYDPGATGTAQAGNFGRKTRNTYDAFGQLVLAKVQRNAVLDTWATTTHYFDLGGHETATIDALGYLTLRQFDALGNQTKVSEYATAVAAGWSASAYVLPAANADDRVTVYAYDRMNRKTSETRMAVEVSTAANGTSARGNLATSYGYDAVGNQTSVTDATGKVTFTYYDALGRITAVAAPARTSTVSGASLTPLTTFRRDAHGNVLVKAELVNGATSATAAAFQAGAADAADRFTVTRYDSLGHATQVTDANLANAYSSYDAYGHVAKRWQGVTGNDGVTHTTYETSVYDKLGRLVERRTPAPSLVGTDSSGHSVNIAQAAQVIASTEYDAFGEVTRQGSQGGRQEYFDYDTAGRVWRTNTGDGSDRILLYDLQGNNSAEIRSSGSGRDNVDIKTFANAEAAAANPYTRRTDTGHDLLGRVTLRIDATRQEVQGGVRVQCQYTTATIAHSADYLDSTNRVALTWNSLSGLGSGDIKVSLTYTTPVVVAHGESGESGESGGATWVYGGTQRTYTSQDVQNGDVRASGTTLQWSENVLADDDHGVGAIVRIVVSKKDKYGNWVTVIDQAPGYGSPEIDLAAPPDPNASVLLQLRAAGSAGDTGWWTAGLVAFGNGYRFNAAGVGSGNYEYRVTVNSGNTGPRVTATGVVAITQPNGVGQSPGQNGDTHWQRPVVQQKTDRWGNVVEITDPRNAAWKTTYKYNANNQIVQQVLPDAGRGAATASIYYDALGRQVAMRDANGYVTGQVFDAGGNLVRELHADGGIVNHAYDAFGEKVQTVDAENKTVRFAYDRLGRLLRTDKGVALVFQAAGTAAQSLGARMLSDRWTYDQLGRKLTQTNGNAETVRYAYDLAGNLVATTQPLGQTVRSAYDAQGRKTAEIDANGNASSWTYDYFGLLTAHVDLGGARYSYTYDNARQLTYQSSTRGQSITYSYDAAGQVTVIQDWSDGKTTTYAYDLGGRKLRERVVQGGVTYQDNNLAYDARGNLRDVADARVHVVLEYDQVGNRTRVGTFVDYQGTSGEAVSSIDRYYRYDAMNRQVIVDAVDAAGNLGAQGHAIAYDKDGNRIRDTSWGTMVVTSNGAQVFQGFAEDGTAVYSTAPVTYTAKAGYSTEEYQYDSLNRLQGVLRDGTQIDVRHYDGADRVIQSGPGGALPLKYAEIINQGLSPDQMNGKETRLYTYDANGELLHETVLKSDNTLKQSLSWNPAEANAGFVPRGYDAAGNVIGYTVTDHETGVVNEFTSSMVRFEGYQASVTQGRSNKLLPGSTTQQYDVNGFLVGVVDSTQPANSRSFVDDASGKALYVNQAGNVQRQLVVNGEALGQYGVRVNPADPATGFNNNPNFANIADFNFGYARISASYPSASPGAYTIRSGDTLQSIAQSAYGDSSLWYRIADANGLASNRDLKVGQTLNIPNRVSTINNNATTFKPYDPSAIEGDKTPSLATPQPKPQPKKKHSLLGSLLAALVAAVASIYTAGLAAMALDAAAGGTDVFTAGMAALGGGSFGSVALTAGTLGSVTASAVVSAAVGAAAGSLAGQAVGIATGMQDDFSWKSVALSAVSGGVSVGVGAAGIVAGSNPGSVVARAVLANAVTQGIGVATGLQQQFDWQAVAASAAGTGVGQLVAPALGGVLGADSFGQRLGTGLLAGMAAAAARGGRVVVQQVAVDAFGNAIGQAIGTAAASDASADSDVLRRIAAFAAEPGGPVMTPMAQAGGHYYLIGLVGRALGMPDEQLARIMANSQFPDQISATDAFTNGVRYGMTDADYAPGSAGLEMMRAIHALNGRSMEDNLKTFQRIIADNVHDDAIVGVALHALVDSIFHAHDVPGQGMVSYTAPIGHGREGNDPDYITPDKARLAAGAVVVALETVSGNRLSPDQRTAAMNFVNDAIDRATALTASAEVRGQQGITHSALQEFAFRAISATMLGASGSLPLQQPNDIQWPFTAKAITPQLTTEQTQEFLSSVSGRQVSGEVAAGFAKTGMKAVENVINQYRRLTGQGGSIEPFRSSSLYDTRVWSIRGWFESYPGPSPRARIPY